LVRVGPEVAYYEPVKTNRDSKMNMTHSKMMRTSRIGFAAFAVGVAVMMIAPASLLASEARVKVSISEPGFYRVTVSELAPLFGMLETELAGTPLTVKNMGQFVFLPSLEWRCRFLRACL
jgi:hypothetical protein